MHVTKDRQPMHVRPTRKRWWALAIFGVLGLAALGLWAALHRAERQAIQFEIGPQALEDRFGIRIVLITVTAGGGLVDLRYQVVDAEKAPLIWETENLPVLIAEDSGTTLRVPPPRARPDKIEAGHVYFLLVPNAEGAIRPGTRVTLVFDNVRVEHLTVE